MYLNAKKQGDMHIFLGSDVSQSGDKADINLSLLLNDGNEVEQFYTSNRVAWNPLSTCTSITCRSNWTESGDVRVWTESRASPDSLWIITGSFEYDRHQYIIDLVDKNKDGSELFHATGNGAYGGSWTDW